MSLRSALARLPHDRDGEALVRELLKLLRRHPNEWLNPARIANSLDACHETVFSMLEVLADTFVLDFDDGPPRYRYRADKLTELEIDRYVRRADSHSGMLQSNVEKFRRRYGN